MATQISHESFKLEYYRNINKLNYPNRYIYLSFEMSGIQDNFFVYFYLSNLNFICLLQNNGVTNISSLG